MDSIHSLILVVIILVAVETTRGAPGNLSGNKKDSNGGDPGRSLFNGFRRPPRDEPISGAESEESESSSHHGDKDHSFGGGESRSSDSESSSVESSEELSSEELPDRSRCDNPCPELQDHLDYILDFFGYSTYEDFYDEIIGDYYNRDKHGQQYYSDGYYYDEYDYIEDSSSEFYQYDG